MADVARHRVVVIGGGFGGLYAVRALDDAPVEVTLVDRRNFHLFQPLLYQVATGSLSSAEIAVPLRGVLRGRPDVRVLLGEVGDIDVANRFVTVRTATDDALTIPYDSLIVAAGSSHSYFGHEDWEPYAPGLKTIEDALQIRSRILRAFEAAEAEPHVDQRTPWLTFVIVGGGPTGVELAGQVAEIAHDTVARDFRSIDPRQARVLLVDAAPRILGTFDERLGRRAVDQLAGLGVEVRTGLLVQGVDEEGVTVERGGRTERIAARTVVWAAGVVASPLAATLAAAAGTAPDRAGRVVVRPDLTLPGHPEVFVVGDMAAIDDGRGGRAFPGVAPVAMQGGRHAARTIAARLAGKPGPGAFRYHDRGNVATIGRARAVAEIRGLRLWGLPAWALWLGVHIVYLAGFQNRLVVLIRWGFSWLTRGRGARLITRG